MSRRFAHGTAWCRRRSIRPALATRFDVRSPLIRETVYRRSLPLATRDLLIQRSSLGGLAGVIGASSMVVDQLFARDAIGQWIEAGEPSAELVGEPT
jgi:hypothetical protein